MKRSTRPAGPSPTNSRARRSALQRSIPPRKVAHSFTTKAERPGATPRESANLFAVGEVLNDTFEIRDFLGAGGMGQVYEAHDRVLNRRVAIKVAHPQISSTLLRQEAQALAAIRHSCMITVHGVGRHRGIDYIVMERVYGMSLQTHIEARVATGEPFGVNEALDMLVAVTDALAIVHGSGIAHRDLKPGNIMLAPGNRIVLMDFGLVSPEFAVASHNGIAGSPRYMAPETVLGTIAPGEGYLVDIYSLGVLAFHMLLSELPFDGETFDEICGQQVTHVPPDPLTLRPDLPPKLAAMIRSMLEKSPRARPQSAESVARQLRAIRDRIDQSHRDERFRVLIVDDQPDIVKVMTFYVKKACPDAEVRTANDGDTAAQIFREQAPDVMLLDLQMPRMNGIELCMYLRSTRFAARCTIVSVSAGAQESDVQLMRQLGIQHFIAKGRDLGPKVMNTLAEIRRRT